MNLTNGWLCDRGVEYTDLAGKIYQSNPFILRLATSPSLANRRSSFPNVRVNGRNILPRQSSPNVIGFLGYGNSLTTACSSAVSYTLLNTQLTGLTSSHSTGYFSVSYSTLMSPGYAPFVPSSPAGDISTGFSVTNNGILLWTNDAFFQGQARFCYDGSGNIYAVFAYGAQPAGCTLAEISVVELNGCVGPTSLIPGPSGLVFKFERNLVLLYRYFTDV